MRHFGNPIGGPASLGGLSTDRPSRGERYAPQLKFPSDSILTPDEPISSDDREFAAWGWLALLFGSFALIIGSFYLLFVQ